MYNCKKFSYARFRVDSVHSFQAGTFVFHACTSNNWWGHGWGMMDGWENGRWVGG